jgi:hypothetical protein
MENIIAIQGIKGSHHQVALDYFDRFQFIDECSQLIV